MPRRGTIERRIPPPDPRYNSVLVQQFINKVMQRGKKSIAEKIVYQAFDLAAQRLKKPALEIFETAELIRATGVEQDALGRCRLSCIDVRNNTNITNAL